MAITMTATAAEHVSNILPSVAKAWVFVSVCAPAVVLDWPMCWNLLIMLMKVIKSSKTAV